MREPGVLILKALHGAAHKRLALTLKQALGETQPNRKVDAVNALSHCSNCSGPTATPVSFRSSIVPHSGHGLKAISTRPQIPNVLTRKKSRHLPGQSALPFDIPALSTLFGGTGVGKLSRIIAGLRNTCTDFQEAWIAGRIARLWQELEQHLASQRNSRVPGWTNNMQDRMSTSDVLLRKPGNSLARCSDHS